MEKIFILLCCAVIGFSAAPHNITGGWKMSVTNESTIYEKEDDAIEVDYEISSDSDELDTVVKMLQDAIDQTDEIERRKGVLNSIVDRLFAPFWNILFPLTQKVFRLNIDAAMTERGEEIRDIAQ